MKNTIAYEGKIKIKIKNKTVRRANNSGTVELFGLLSALLGDITGNNIGSLSSRIPSHMSILRCNANVEDMFRQNLDFDVFLNNRVLLNNNLPIVERDIQSDGSLILSCTLSNNNLQQEMFETKEYYLVLLNNQNKVLAYSKFNGDVLQQVADDLNTQAIIEWSLSFTNKEIDS